MDTILFRYVLTIAESGSISGAARRLFMYQSALSKQLSRLEAELGFELFDRSKTPLNVTPGGEHFLRFAERFLEVEKDFLEEMGKGEQNRTEHISIGTTHRGGAYCGDHTAAFLEEYPQVELEYLDMSARMCEKSLVEERIELAIYTDPVFSDKVEYMPVEEDPLILIVPKKSPLLEEMDTGGSSLEHPLEVDPVRLRRPDIRYVLSTEEHSLYYAECEFLKKYRIQPKNVLRVDFVDTRYAVASGGGGIMVSPVVTARHKGGGDHVVYCKVKGDELYRYVVIARKKGRRLSRGAEYFWKFMVGRRFAYDKQE